MTEVRCELELEGRLQGVGFRPLAFRLARELNLSGWVRNTAQGVELAIQGAEPAVHAFELRLPRELPPHARIRSRARKQVPLSGERGPFEIAPSEASGPHAAEIPPDLSLCAACEAELLDPTNRRYRYPFTCCTDCGPRYSILEALPYDRANTSMRRFAMCGPCRAEYEDPRSRRLHAQTNCCPDCGPQLALVTVDGRTVSERDSALAAAARAIGAGEIVAIQGIGGFHLVCDAACEPAISRLREAKQRQHKPFALLARDLEHVRRLCEISAREERSLRGPGAPIVLLRRRPDARAEISDAVAPGLPELGVMLPYTPVHRLLMNELAGAVIATSGNLRDEPLCVDLPSARARLGGIASLFLVHDRPIVARVDDSVVRVIADTEVVLRAARGYAPLVLDVPQARLAAPVLALGAHQKNTFAYARGGKLVLAPHVGNLDSILSVETFRELLATCERVTGLEAPEIACDLHPDYASSRVARELATKPHAVQHHEAHVLSCIAEHGISGPVLGVAWDGAGYGRDGTVWGGEFLHGDARGFRRAGMLRPFRLAGGDAAAREPRRSALGLLFALHGESSATDAESRNWIRMMTRGLNSPLTSSAGRLFDGVAALLGLRQVVDYEGQAAVELEAAASSCGSASAVPYPLKLDDGSPVVVDWAPWINGVLEDLQRGLAVAQIAARFHDTLAAVVLAMARRVGARQIVLAGGCFQNRVLCERAISLLEGDGFQVHWNQKVPPNDGGLSVGQALAALERQGR